MATTPNYSFSVYSSTDTDVRFLDFRVATAGSQSTSNFYVIDTVLKQHSDAIDSINATPSAFVVKGTYSSGSLYTASVANYPGYKNEQLIVLSLNQKNTGAVQININGTTNKDVMKYGSDGVLKAVDAGDFVANSPVLCLYDGTRFIVIGITSASSITVTGEAGDILQIADDGTIESSGKKTAQPNGIATLDENGNVVQVANMANSAAAVYSGEPVTIEYADENRIGSVTAYGNNSQTSGTTTAPISMNGVDSVQVSGNNLFLNNAETETKSGITFTVNPDKSVTVNGTNSTSGSAVFYTGYNESLPAGSYTLSGTSSLTGSAEIEIKIKRVRGTFEWFAINSSLHTRTLNIATGDIIDSFYVAVRAGQTADNVKVYPMLNVGSTALPYEPYNGNITQLPIPRELHRIGEAADKCVTRVKSVYDKRVVLDGTEAWAKRTNVSIVGGSAFYPNNFITDALINAPVSISEYFVGRAGLTTALWEARQVGSYVGVQFNAPFTEVSDFTAWLAAHPLTVYYQSTAYDGTNGLDVCLTEYQNDFVELDGTEGVNLGNIDASASVQQFNIYDVLSSPNNSENAICSHFERANVSGGVNSGFQIYNTLLVFGMPRDILLEYGFITGDSDTYIPAFKAYLAAQKAAGTPVQIAYQLATPETYATDPVDFDNTAGPLTVVTGGQVEVKMTDFVTDRTPAFLNKLDKTGDGSDVTVTFTEAATDTDIASGDKLSILFGKILKRFTNILNGTTKVGYATKADTDNLGNQITETYANSLDVADNTIVLKNKIGENLSTITVPYANSAGNVATSIKEMGIAVQTASPYAWFLNYTGSGNKDGARKYYASVYADNATYSTSAGSSNNIVIYNNNWSGTDGSISAIYANAEKTYVNLASSNAAGTAWPNISVQRINGHALNMALNGTSLSITW